VTIILIIEIGPNAIVL